MRSVLNGLAVSLIAGASLCGCAVDRGLVVDAQGTRLAPSEITITAAVFGSTAPAPIITVQGMLELKGEPVTDELVVIALITDESINDVIFESEPVTLSVVDGRFTRTINLPEAQQIAEAGNLSVSFLDAKTGQPVGGALPITFAPRAWAAEYAANAGSASTAVSASSAGVAGELANDMSIELELSAGYENYGFSYDGIRATRVGNMVHLSGLVQISGGGNLTFASLPAGMRPIGRHLFSASSNGDYVRVDVRADGGLQLVRSPVSVDWFSLSGMSFPVAP